MALDGLRPKDRVFVEYDDPADTRLHERLILSLPSHDELCCCTPHYDVYVENLSSWSAIYRSGPRQGTPSAWYKRYGTKRIVKFDLEELEGKTAELLEEAEAEAPSTVSMVHLDGREDPSLLLGAEGEGGAVVDDSQPLRTGAGGGKAVARTSGAPTGDLRRSAESAARGDAEQGESDEGAVWVSIENRGGLSMGDPIPDEGRLAKCGDRGIFEYNGTFVAVAKAGTFKPPTHSNKFIDIDPAFRRGRPNFTDLVEHLSSSGGDFKGLDGPRTCLWLLQQFEARDTTPTTRHWWWRNTMGLDISAKNVETHLFISQVLELGLVQDRLNLSQLHSFELVARKYQAIEKQYGETLRKTLSPDKGSLWLSQDESDLFMGTQSTSAVALVCPTLDKFVSGKMADSSALLKERRKAREEVTLWTAEVNKQTGGKAPKADPTKNKGKGKDKKE